MHRNRVLFLLILGVLVLTACGRAGGRENRIPDFTPPPLDSVAGPPTSSESGELSGAPESQPESPPETVGSTEEESGEESPPELPQEQPAVETPQLPPSPVELEALDGTAESLIEAWEEAYNLSPGVPLSVTATEAEVEAYISQAMVMSGYGENVNDIAVMLDNGQLGVTFEVKLGQLNRMASASVVFAVALDAAGGITASVVSAEVSGERDQAELPPDMMAALNQAVSAALSGAEVSEQAGVDVTFTGLVIDDGAITISGYVTPI